MDRVVDQSERDRLPSRSTSTDGPGDHAGDGDAQSRADCRARESWGCLRKVMAQKKVVACDVVELSPLPGLMAPNFLCAKLVCKILGYRFGMGARVVGAIRSSTR